MSDVIKLNDDTKIVIDDDFGFSIKKNGLTITLTPEEMEVLEVKLKAFANKLQAEILDSINGFTGREK